MTYFFDTCALLHNFKKDLPKGFYISSITLKELENIKTSCHKDEEVKYQARQLLHKLEKADYNVELYNSYLDEYLISYERDTSIPARPFAQQQPGMVYGQQAAVSAGTVSLVCLLRSTDICRRAIRPRHRFPENQRLYLPHLSRHAFQPRQKSV